MPQAAEATLLRQAWHGSLPGEKGVRIIIPLFLLCAVSPALAQLPEGTESYLDVYGGDSRYSCSKGRTGYFYVYRDDFSRRWWYCDPEGHRFFSLAVDVVDSLGGGKDYLNRFANLYGRAQNGCSYVLNRLRDYGFNTIGVYAGWAFLPVATKAGPGCRVRMPFIYLLTPEKHFGQNGLGRYFKDVVSTVGPSYKGWRGTFPDVWDPNWAALVNWRGPGGPWGQANPFGDPSSLNGSPWLLGVSIDDTDQVWGTRGTGPVTQQPVTSWYVSVTTPFQIYSGRWKRLYSDPVMHAKQEWSAWLQGKAGVTSGGVASRSASTVTLTFAQGHPFTVHDLLTISGCSDPSFDTVAGQPVIVTSLTPQSVTYTQPGSGKTATACTAAQGPGYTLQALNQAWSANYTTFGSAARAIHGEVIGTGDGTTTRFVARLAHPVIDPFTLEVVVGGNSVAGDCPWFEKPFCKRPTQVNMGTIESSAALGVAEGDVDYRSGELRVNLDKAPPKGAQITVNYLYGGWPHVLTGGRGLLDEDGTNPWFPAEQTLPALYGTPVPRVALDIDNFEDHLFQKYYQTLAAAVRSVLPRHLVFSNDWIGPHDRPGVIRQASQYCDVLLVGEVPDESEITRNIYDVGHKPLQRYELIEALPDSPLASRPCSIYQNGHGSFPSWVCQPTQEARGKRYLQQMETTIGLTGSDGYGYFVGWSWWQMTDNAGQMQNFGLFTLRDNAYDGVEARRAWSKDRYGFQRGGEEGDYGDFISWVKKANLLWLRLGGPPTATARSLR